MLGPRIILAKKSRDEGEKPFWISYADLMTALMILFLVIMTVLILSLVRGVEGPKEEREKAISKILSEITVEAQKQGIHTEMDLNKFTIGFANNVLFEKNKDKLNQNASGILVSFVPILLTKIKEQEDGTRKWFKRVVVEGYADPSGTYLHNLELSMDRAERVICVLLDNSSSLSGQQKQEVRRLFMTGGYSFNSSLSTPEESRRVEMRLEFWSVEDIEKGKNKQLEEVSENLEVGKCTLDD